MLSQYPYGTIKVTSFLHALIAIGMLIANGHALYRINSTIRIVTSVTGLYTLSLLNNYVFGTLIVIGVYFLFVGVIGETAGSKRKNKTLVYNCKIVFLVVNILSIFFYCWLYGSTAFIMLSLQSHFFDSFGIEANLKANVGLAIAELLLSIFSTIICCISGEPTEREDPDLISQTNPGAVNVNMFTQPPQQTAYFPHQIYNPQYSINREPESAKF